MIKPTKKLTLSLILTGAVVVLLSCYKWLTTPDTATTQPIAPTARLADTAALQQHVADKLHHRQQLASREIGADIDQIIDQQAMEAKLAGLTKNITLLREPTEAELNSFYQQHRSKYREDSQFGFRHRLFSTAKYGGRAHAQAEAARQTLSPTDSDKLSAPYRYLSSSQIDETFGSTFADKLLALVTDSKPATLPCWAGPITSRHGSYLVCIETAVLGEIPDLQAVRTEVINDWRFSMAEHSASPP